MEEVFTELIPLYGDKALAVSDIVIRVNPEDRKRVAAAVARAQIVGPVTDEESFALAKQAAGELKALTNEIQDSKRAAQRPFEAVLAAFDELAKSTTAPVAAESHRLQGYLNQYIVKLENEAKEAARKQREEREREARVYQQKIKELENERRQAEEEARVARNEIDRERAKNEAARKELAAAQAELARAMELEVAAMSEAPKKGLVPDGRVTHPFKFRLMNPEATVKAGCIRLLRVELNVLNCQDSCKAQLQIEPDKDPQLPGIEVTRDTSVSIKATSRIS